MAKTEESKTSDIGQVSIADSVLCTIAGIAATEIEGVVDLRGGFMDGVREATTRKRDFTTGVELTKGEGDAYDIDLFIIVEYDTNIWEVAVKTQKAVKEKIEVVTGKKIKTVDVSVVDIQLPNELIKKKK